MAKQLDPLLLLVDQGLVNSRDPILTSTGELEIAEDSEYRPHDRAIYPIKEPTKFNSSPEASAIKGGFFARFEGGTSKFITSLGTTWRQATAGETGTFSNLLTGLTESDLLDHVHYENKEIIFNGKDRARVLDKDGTITLLGMAANTEQPVVDLGVGAGAGFTVTTGTAYEYWIEEQVRDADGVIIKRNADFGETSELATVEVGGLVRETILVRGHEFSAYVLEGTSTLVKPRIFRPAIVNSDATHWVVYRSAPNGAHPIGAQIGEATIATTYIDDLSTGTDPELPDGDIYETVAVSVVGITTVTPKNGPAPVPETGDMFEECFIGNDVDDPQKIRWSFPREIHSYPIVNVKRMTVKEGAKVTFIKALGRLCIVGTSNSVWRVDYLPRQDDSAFQRERMAEEIAKNHGIVGPRAGCIFSYGKGDRLAYVSPSGIHITDGEEWDDIIDDADWDSLVDRNQLDKAVLRDNPAMYRLEFYFTPPGETRNTKCMYLHYNPFHAKSGIGGGFRAKLTGPNNRPANDAFVADINTQKVVFTCGEDGTLYREDAGRTLMRGVNFRIRTVGRFTANAPAAEATIRKVIVRHKGALPGQLLNAKFVMTTEDQVQTFASAQLDLSHGRSAGVGFDGVAEELAVELSMVDPLSDVRINMLTVKVDPTGDEER